MFSYYHAAGNSSYYHASALHGTGLFSPVLLAVLFALALAASVAAGVVTRRRHVLAA